MIRWKIEFYDINETMHVINIYDDDYTGSTVTELTGAENVFVTQEDDNQDVLTPIRTSSGNINIVCDRDTWLGVINHGNRVELIDENDQIEWCGYISKSAYSGTLFEPVTEYAIPVHCILSQLQSAYFKVAPYNSPTFATIFTEAFRECGAHLPYYFVWPSSLGRYPQFLECRFQRSNYYNESNNEDENTEISEKTYFDVISQMCMFYGITLRTDGEHIVFLTPEINQTYYRGVTAELEDVETDGKSAIVTAVSITQTQETLEDKEYMSTDHHESVLPPFKSIKITQQYNPYGNLDALFPNEGIENYIRTHFTSIVRSEYHNVPLDIHKVIFNRNFTKNWIYVDRQDEGYWYQKFESSRVLMSVYKYVETPGEDPELIDHYADINSLDVIDPSEEAGKVDYSFRNMLFFSATPQALRVFTIESKEFFSFYGGNYAFVLDFDLLNITQIEHTRKLEWMLRVGNKYWNGSQWVDDSGSFLTQIENNKCKSNRTLGDGYNGQRGLIIPIPSQGLKGNISLSLVGCESGVVGAVSDYITDLSLSFVKKNLSQGGSEEQGKDVSLELFEVLSTKDLEEYNQDCDFSTWGGVDGYGIVLDHSFSPLRDLYYGGEAVEPGRQKLEWVKALRSAPVSELEIDVRADDTLRLPYNCVEEGDFSGALLQQSITHDWRNGTIKVKLIQIQ